MHCMTTKQSINDSSMKPSKSTATAKYIDTLPVPHTRLSHEDIYTVRGRYQRTSHGKYIHLLHSVRSCQTHIQNTISRCHRSAATSLSQKLTPRHFPQLIPSDPRLLKGRRYRGVSTMYSHLHAETGNYVKLGRIEYLVIEIRDNKGTSTLK